MSQAGDTQWPPRSPHEALLSTPGGRDRIRRLAERASPSPSPIKRSMSSTALRRRAMTVTEKDIEDEDDEDEETLQLQLQEIQARLKLKKLQKKSKQGSDSESDKHRALPASFSRAESVATNRTQSRASALRKEQLERPKSQTDVHVPVSPVRRARPVENPRSPGRVLLGIDKGVKANDISLKRAPSLRRPQETELQDARRAGGFLHRASSQASSRASDRTSSQTSAGDAQPKTFSERLAAMRGQETDRLAREERRRKARSMAFDIDPQQMESFKKTAVELPNKPPPAPEFSRDDILNSLNKPTSGIIRSKTTGSLRSTRRIPSDSTDSTSNLSFFSRPRSQASFNEQVYIEAPKMSSEPKVQPDQVPESEASEYEPYSSVHLSKRIIPHKVLTRTFTGKKTFLIPDLLRTVKSPDYSAPDIEEDMVLLGVIASKSEPKSHNTSGKNERGKYMVMTLTDLKWELDLFLFDSAFERFWKLTPGTIIAILNPAIMPPPRGRTDTGKFSLTLNSSEDTLLEIGSARDLGYCKSVKKDGKTCDSWVDKRHTEFCDFHVNLQLTKTKAGRLEVAGMGFGKGGGGGRSGWKTNSKDTTGHFERRKEAEAEKTTRYDRESHSQIYVSKGTSSAKLLDDVDFMPDAFHRGTTKDERLRRHLIAQEKERALAENLGKLGGGLGADYLRKKAASHVDQNLNDETPAEPTAPPPDAASLGLLGGKAKEIHLSPVKRKRTDKMSSTTAIGWGGNLSKELGRMKNGENLHPPVKKKTRFVTEKGIREAGRESFGGEMVQAQAIVSNDLDDDDDDLDIV